MENKISQRGKIYDPINQPVSYAIVYGVGPELRELLIPYKFTYNPKGLRDLEYQINIETKKQGEKQKSKWD